MKKLIIAGLLIVVVLTVSIAAYAKDQTAGSTEVIYEYIAPYEGGGENSGGYASGGEDDVTTYIINIPARVNITTGNDVIPITLSKNAIADEKKVAVAIDWAKSYMDNGDSFYLYKNGEFTSGEKITCRIMQYSDMTTSAGRYADEKDVRRPYIAEFPSGSLTPLHGGFLRFIPLHQYSGVSSGTYKGSLYFNISVVDQF